MSFFSLRFLSKCHNKVTYVFFRVLTFFRVYNIYQPVFGTNIIPTKAKMRMSKKTEDFILTHIDKHRPASLLDIGCNLGYFSMFFAKKEMFVTGIEGAFRYFLACNILKNVHCIENLSFLNIFITPKNIVSLPTYDNVLLLNVFHHWCLAYGKEKGCEMIATLWEKTSGNLFLSFHDGEKYKQVLPIMEGDIKGWVSTFFKDRGAKEIITYDAGGRFLAVIKK